MHDLPKEIFSVADVREIDRVAIEEQGIAGYTLMTRAGEAAVDATMDRYAAANHWQVVCGAGNNAGDGYVVARLARERGIDVTVTALVDPSQLKGDAATAYSDYTDAGGTVELWHGEFDAGAKVIIDALLGSGLERDVAGEFKAAVDAVNEHPAPVVALDIPTGLNADTGVVMGSAIRAQVTVTFVGLKSGLFTGDGREYCGEIVFAGLEIPAECRRREPAYRRVHDGMLRDCLAPRPRTSHKGDFGHVLVIGGGEGMPGAVRLCGEAALRGGAGLVSIATHPDHAAMLTATRPELMSHAINDPNDVGQLIERATVIAFGPGLGQDPWAEQLRSIVESSKQPSVWDADALNLLAKAPSKDDRRILTPHPGEAARLLGVDTATVQADRPAALRALQSRYGGVAVLKGAGTLTSGDEAVPWLVTAGNPGMSGAGMGDVLTGLVAAFLAQGMSPEMAAAVGAEVHARSGDRAAAGGERGLVASDLLGEVRSVINP